MKKIFKFIFPVISVSSIFTTASLTACSCNSTTTHLRLTRDDWEDQTKTALNQCIANYGIDGKNYSKDNYVVFDFDNTTAIFDIQHQCTNYQIETMAYSLTKAEMTEALSSSLGNTSRSLEQFGFDFTYEDLINDIVKCYDNLQTKYGPFTCKGVDESKLESLHKENDWIDFAVKLRYLYSTVSTVQGDKERGKWSTFQFTNMTPQEVYDLEYRCLEKYSTVDSHNENLTAKTSITGSAEQPVTVEYLQGVSVTENIKELYKTIKDNGIDIWIVSASQIDQVRAAADVFGIGQYVSGCFALTNKLGDDGKYIAQYDTYGKGYIKQDGQWVMGKSNPNLTSGVGKSLTIVDNIAPDYNNKGPIMCFGDSTGDFNFCSEFKDTKLVVCFNRADRSVTDGGALMAAIAIYQKINSMTLDKANQNNDTLYCLQGRNDNGKRSFRNSNKTIRLGYEEEHLFKNRANYDLLAYIMNSELSIKDACQLSLIHEVEGIQVGWLTEYLGYHTR